MGSRLRGNDGWGLAAYFHGNDDGRTELNIPRGVPTMARLNIRALTEDDAGDFRRLRLRALKEHPDAFGSSYEEESALSLETVAARMRRTAESPHAFTLGAYREGELVGMVGFYREQREKMRHKATIWGMYVPSEEQGKGIGRALLTEAVERRGWSPGWSRWGSRSSLQTGAREACTPRSASRPTVSSRTRSSSTESISTRSSWCCV